VPKILIDISESFDLLVLKIQKFGDYTQIAEIQGKGQFEPNISFRYDFSAR